MSGKGTAAPGLDLFCTATAWRSRPENVCSHKLNCWGKSENSHSHKLILAIVLSRELRRNCSWKRQWRHRVNTGKCSCLCLFIRVRTPPGIVRKLVLDWLYRDTATQSLWTITSSSSQLSLTDIANGNNRQSSTYQQHRQLMAARRRRQRIPCNRGMQPTQASDPSTSNSRNVFSENGRSLRSKTTTSADYRSTS